MMSTRARVVQFGGAAILIVFGILTWLWVQPRPDLSASFPRVREAGWGALVGLWVLTVAVSHLIVFYFVQTLRCATKLRREGVDLVLPALVGMLETILYLAAFLGNRPEFIGLWLGLKTAGGWKQWTEDDKGRRRFLIFLLGSGMSVLIALIGFVLMLKFALEIGGASPR